MIYIIESIIKFVIKYDSFLTIDTKYGLAGGRKQCKGNAFAKTLPDPERVNRPGVGCITRIGSIRPRLELNLILPRLGVSIFSRALPAAALVRVEELVAEQCGRLVAIRAHEPFGVGQPQKVSRYI